MAIKLTISVLFILLFSPPLWAIEVVLKPDVLRQGDVLLIRAKAYEELQSPHTPLLERGVGGGKEEMRGLSDENIEGIFMDKKLNFFMTASGNFMALAGIDMKAAPGEYTLTLIFNNKKIFERNLKILPASFGLQRLTLPKEMVDLTPEILNRVRIEQARLAVLWLVVNEKFWKGKFIMPIDGRIKSLFGVRRIINKEERSPHSGIDIEADEGDPVAAPNSGRVVLVDNQFFGGKTLVLDHGYGIYSIFHHLSRITVSEGQSVKRGDTIGHAGSTGRATGPHLHWGVRLQGERVNPMAIVNLEVE